MTDLDTLLRLAEAATPGPWIRPWGTRRIHQAFGPGCDDIGLSQQDIDLACAAVNNLAALVRVALAARDLSELVEKFGGGRSLQYLAVKSALDALDATP